MHWLLAELQACLVDAVSVRVAALAVKIASTARPPGDDVLPLLYHRW